MGLRAPRSSATTTSRVCAASQGHPPREEATGTARHVTLELEQRERGEHFVRLQPATAGDGVHLRRLEPDPGEHSRLPLGQRGRDGRVAGRRGGIREALCPLRICLHELRDVPEDAGPVREEPVRAPALEGPEWSRHSPDVAPRLRAVASGYEGAALLRRLDDDHGVAEARDDPIARREPPRQRRFPEVVLRDEATGTLHGPKQTPVVSGIDDRVSSEVQTASRSTPRTSRSPSGETYTCRRSIL